ncbi:hypothetical protein [Thermosynechococcus sp. OHK43]|jgi:hypothetical protein|uniref:hypothetical protein n=1 Tax=Thermosynechococcus sp. OHK43 TaxID=2763133 RepID=UPI0025DDF695|nr:hypothetical protein [Thermosynechococcus sp. OHK43]
MINTQRVQLTATELASEDSPQDQATINHRAGRVLKAPVCFSPPVLRRLCNPFLPCYPFRLLFGRHQYYATSKRIHLKNQDTLSAASTAKSSYSINQGSAAGTQQWLTSEGASEKKQWKMYQKIIEHRAQSRLKESLTLKSQTPRKLEGKLEFSSLGGAG